MFDSTRRPSKFEGFTHNRALLRLDDLPYQSGSKDSTRTTVPSGGFEIWWSIFDSKDRRQNHTKEAER